MESERRLIYVNALKSELEWLKSVVDESNKDNVQDFIQRIENAPTVDAVEVVHGRWEWLGPYRYNDDGVIGTCSVCKERLRLFAHNYCPNCGAKMDGGKDNETE